MSLINRFAGCFHSEHVHEHVLVAVAAPSSAQGAFFRVIGLVVSRSKPAVLPIRNAVPRGIPYPGSRWIESLPAPGIGAADRMSG